MAAKKISDLLDPTGDPDTDHIRGRLRNLHEMNRVVYPRKKWVEMARCMDRKATPSEVVRILDGIMSETLTEEFAREIEFRLVDAHGLDRYAGNPEVLKKDIEKASVKYRIMHVMDAIYQSCGHPELRGREERLDDAAFHVVRHF